MGTKSQSGKGKHSRPGGQKYFSELNHSQNNIRQRTTTTIASLNCNPLTPTPSPSPGTRPKKMKVFSLKGQALKLDTAADIEPHIADLKTATDVEEFHLEGNTIGVSAAQHLASILATKPTLRYANLADIFTGRLLSEIPQALDALLQALLQCPNLTQHVHGARSADVGGCVADELERTARFGGRGLFVECAGREDVRDCVGEGGE